METVKNNMEDNLVIVLDLGNYKESCRESVPFKAKVVDKYEYELVVKSLKTNKEYEIYYNQILEFYEDEDLKNIVNITKYGDN